MALKKKSYLAKSNRGKAGQVLVNNILVGCAQKKKAKLNTAKKEATSEKRRSTAKSNARAKEAKRNAKEAERQLKRDQKSQEKFDTYLARTKLVCEKLGVDKICCEEIVQEAYDAEVTVAQISKVIVEGREGYWEERTIHLQEEEYISKLHKKCLGVVKSGKIYEKYEDDLIEDVIEQRPNLNDLMDCSAFRKYNYLTDLEKLCLEQTESGHVLQEYEDEFIEQVLDAKPELNEFVGCSILNDYISATKKRWDEVENRLKVHIDHQLIELTNE